MTEYKFYRVDSGDKTLIKTWESKPTAEEVMTEVNKLAEEVILGKPDYIRMWGDDDKNSTYFDFGSWSVLVNVEPSVYNLLLDSWRSEE